MSMLSQWLAQRVAQPVSTRAPAVAYSLANVETIGALQHRLTELGYLDPPPDGAFGPTTKWALDAFSRAQGTEWLGEISPAINAALNKAQPLPLNPGTDLAGSIVRAMLKRGDFIARHPTCVNIVYVEGMNPDGTTNDNRNNVFNDLRTVIRVGADGVPQLVGKWDATTEPSRKWTLEPMNPDGAFHIKFGQYKAWILGYHHTQEALVQCGEIEGYRDPDKTFKRDLRHPVKGSEFGVNEHGGYDLPHDDMGNSSAGCLVGRETGTRPSSETHTLPGVTPGGHREFMALVKGDARFKANPTYRFMTSIFPASDIV